MSASYVNAAEQRPLEPLTTRLVALEWVASVLPAFLLFMYAAGVVGANISIAVYLIFRLDGQIPTFLSLPLVGLAITVFSGFTIILVMSRAGRSFPRIRWLALIVAVGSISCAVIVGRTDPLESRATPLDLIVEGRQFQTSQTGAESVLRVCRGNSANDAVPRAFIATCEAFEGLIPTEDEVAKLLSRLEEIDYGEPTPKE